MYPKLPRSTVWGAALVVGTLILPSLAHAQMGMPEKAARSLMEQGTSPADAKEVPPPPALPGAAAHGGTPAPASRMQSDMSPNDALFDAINRGDIAAARDALSRGAQLDAHNVLELTPLDLAVDLGRNDIAFLLLSMRDPGTGTTTPAASRPPATSAAAKQPPRRGVVTARESLPVTPSAPPNHAPLFAHDGGAPIPSIGFLGFDPRRGTP